MSQRFAGVVRALLVGMGMLATAIISLAQGHGGPPPGGSPPGLNGSPAGNSFPVGPRGNGAPPPSPGQGNQSGVSTMRGGLQLGPPGRWWDDKGFAKSLKLRPEQQASMDTVFAQNRGALLSSYENLKQAEAQLETLSRAAVPDEAALFAQIDRVAQARSTLEKANTHMLLLIRKEMDPDQIARLESHR